MDIESMARKLMEGENGEQLKKLASTAENAQRAAGLDISAAEDAVRRGDSAQMKAILSNVLATPEGRALAAKLREAMNGHGG